MKLSFDAPLPAILLLLCLVYTKNSMSDQQSTGSSSSGSSHSSYDSIPQNHQPIVSGDEDDGDLRTTPILLPNDGILNQNCILRSIFLLLGVGSLIPWNAFVSAKPYFQSRLCDANTSESIAPNFELWFGLIWNLASVVSLGLWIFYNHWSDQQQQQSSSNHRQSVPTSSQRVDDNDASSFSTSTDHKTSYWWVMIPLSIYLIVFILTAALVLLPNWLTPDTFWMVARSTLAICGICGAVATAGILSTAGSVYAPGIASFCAGQSLGGLAVAMANYGTAIVEDPEVFRQERCNASSVFLWDHENWSEQERERELWFQSNHDVEDQPVWTCTPYTNIDFAVFGYFSAGCLVLAICLIGFHYIHKVQPQRHQEPQSSSELQRHDALRRHGIGGSMEPLMDNSPRIGLEMKTGILGSNRSRTDHHLSSPSSYHDEDPLQHHQDFSATISSVAEALPQDEEVPTAESQGIIDIPGEDQLAIFRTIQSPAVAIFLTFGVTLCIFPGWISQLRSVKECLSHARMNNDLYIPFRFVIFNAGDLFGRMLVSYVDMKRISHMATKLVLSLIHI